VTGKLEIAARDDAHFMSLWFMQWKLLRKLCSKSFLTLGTFFSFWERPRNYLFIHSLSV
jgi:hypothetical protein